MTETTYQNKIGILSDLWINCRTKEEFAELFEYGDLSFPLAFLLKAEIVGTTERAESFIHEVFQLLLETLEIEDNGFENIDELLDSAALEP